MKFATLPTGKMNEFSLSQPELKVSQNVLLCYNLLELFVLVLALLAN